MKPTVHKLKTWPTYWDAVARGEKLFEVRKNDRFFQAGDIVELIRLTRDDYGASYDMTYQGASTQLGEPKTLRFRVGSVLQGGQFGIEPMFCVFSLLPLPQSKATALRSESAIKSARIAFWRV